VSTDATVKGSVGTAGGLSGSARDGKFALSAASTNQQTSTANPNGNSSVRGGIFQLGIWLSILIAMLMLLPIVIWLVVKVVRRSETSQNGDMVYQNLQDARQIYVKIIAKS
jgi:hypothetical protein